MANTSKTFTPVGGGTPGHSFGRFSLDSEGATCFECECLAPFFTRSALAKHQTEAARQVDAQGAA